LTQRGAEGAGAGAAPSASAAYSGTRELAAIDESLVGYNHDLVTKLSRGFVPGTRVLEFGAGMGTLAALWRERHGAGPDCVEIDEALRTRLAARGLAAVASLDELSGTYDWIYTSNVLEHIDDDGAALKGLAGRLRKGGTLVVYVPAFQCLYNDIDAAVGHCRRYGRQELVSKVQDAGLDVVSWRYVDCIGFWAWLWVKLRGYREQGGEPDRAALRFFDRVVYPVSRTLDALGARFVLGKNLLVTARR
jgi:SAM-dependent methyltransferase